MRRVVSCTYLGCNQNKTSKNFTVPTSNVGEMNSSRSTWYADGNDNVSAMYVRLQTTGRAVIAARDEAVRRDVRSGKSGKGRQPLDPAIPAISLHQGSYDASRQPLNASNGQPPRKWVYTLRIKAFFAGCLSHTTTLLLLLPLVQSHISEHYPIHQSIILLSNDYQQDSLHTFTPDPYLERP